MRPNKTEDGLVHLILCSHKVLREMLCNVLVYICKDLVFFYFFVKKNTFDWTNVFSEGLGGLDFSELIIDDLWLRKALWSFVGVSLMKVYVANKSRLDALAMKIIFNTSCSIVGNAIKCHIITD